jgi:hypothetical protein
VLFEPPLVVPPVVVPAVEVSPPVAVLPDEPPVPPFDEPPPPELPPHPTATSAAAPESTTALSSRRAENRPKVIRIAYARYAELANVTISISRSRIEHLAKHPPDTLPFTFSLRLAIRLDR